MPTIMFFWYIPHNESIGDILGCTKSIDKYSHQPDRSMLNESGHNISVDPNVTYPFVHCCMLFNNVQYISRQKKCVMWVAEGRKKATSVYYGLCTILSNRKLIDTLHAMLIMWLVCTNASRAMGQNYFSIKWKMAILLHSASLQSILK